MRLNKLKVGFSIVEVLLLCIAIGQMINTKGWVYNTLIYLPMLNVMMFCMRKELRNFIYSTNNFIRFIID